MDHWKGDHHGVSIFVPSHRPPGPTVANYPKVTYVLDGIASATAQAKAAALFDVLQSRVELEIVRVIDTPEATHIRYRVRR